ncbi:MAG: hypothetical protein COA58_10735 [Bacteroidetes bacterium]|nr:MAG: hypothetical protein COA58_10735 [Bacteroidota bacterium]
MNIKETTVQAWIDAISIGHTEERAFYYLCNQDESIRWIWPATNKKPVFLKFYNATSFRAQVFAVVVKLLFVFRLQRLLAKKTKASFDFFPTAFNIDSSREWALFTGTKGPNRKLIIAAFNFSNQFSFTKVAFGDNSYELLENEKNSIQRFEKDTLLHVELPKILSFSKDYLQLSEVSEGRRVSALEAKHFRALQELSQRTTEEILLCDTEFYNRMLNDYKELNVYCDPRLPQAMKRKLHWLISSLSDQEKVHTSIAHGDFTPWNCFVTESKLSLYDLEMMRGQMPKGYDVFHFVIQNGILVNHDSWKTISKEIMEVICPTIFGGDKEKTKYYLKLYLLVNSTYYLNVYSKQQEWHTQVNWLLQTWNEAISWVLEDTNESRKLVLMDVFDFMQNTEYVVLKFKGYLPEQISSMSDVDFCTNPSNAKALIEFLERHCLVKVARIKNLSFMKNIQLVLNNSELLSIDCIWRLKRKNLVIYDIDRLLAKSSVNVFGVKQPCCLTEAEYVNHFYALNKAPVPVAYRSKSFELETRKMVNGSNPIAIQKSLKSMLRKKKVNQGFFFLINSINYLIDTLKDLIGPRGFIVTFSGVDGAGKSTLIEITKHRIDKQLRKSVVVLRHRPSLLPIISAWTLGKAVAEQKAEERLPRQGENKSTISSLLRFGYYYTDYLIGQFYVYGKYVMRGKVVLYDRYYFDFINDSRRSNITLPTWLMKLGYKLIMKPHLNFFLYADVDTILARKQELDAETITTLTRKYLQLFKKLNEEGMDSKYLPVKNVDLDVTVNVIMDEVKIQAA